MSDDEEATEPTLTAEEDHRRQENIKSLLENRLEVERKPLVQGLIAAEQVLRQRFRCPYPQAQGNSERLKRHLQARKRFVPWGNGRHDRVFVHKITPPSSHEEEEKPKPPPCIPDDELDGVEPLIIWQPPEGDLQGGPVAVDSMLTKCLRPHQREGVQFMFECVTGVRQADRLGCILADDMGLGKSLQGLTLLWTCLQSGHSFLGGDPIAKRVLIVCPTSLVANWDNECSKWLKGRLRTMPICESTREEVVQSIAQFLAPQNFFKVLIISYETFRIHVDRFRAPGACDLLICDEAHRLKNDQTQTTKALDSLACKRRVLLSGTPMQNHLEEFYAMVNFANPGVLGTPAQFRRQYETPIVAGREPDATEEQAALGQQRSAELSHIVNDFILRRTNNLLSAHLPPKVIITMCCKLSDLQCGLYCHFLASTSTRSLVASKKAARVLSSITALKKLCNHPKLIYDAVHSKTEDQVPDGFQGCAEYFPPGLFDNGRSGRGGLPVGWEHLSGKFAVLAQMLQLLHKYTDDRIVIVSNYTQTLDLVSQLCREKQYPFLRLDGSTSISKRQKLVQKFNDQTQNQFVFLLSSKAGGCGLNLIGGNRLVLFDVDWNPANDQQAAARVWRDGQKKRVFVYRMLGTGTIEEKVYQRQLSKGGLQSLVNQTAGTGSNMMTSEELRDLFSLRLDTISDTLDSMCRNTSGAAAQAVEGGAKGSLAICRDQVGAPKEEELHAWGQHSSTATVPDAITQAIGDDIITFCFTCKVDGMAVEEDKPLPINTCSAPARGPTTAARGVPASAAGPLGDRSGLLKKSRGALAPARDSMPAKLPAPGLVKPAATSSLRPETHSHITEDKLAAVLALTASNVPSGANTAPTPNPTCGLTGMPSGTHSNAAATIPIAALSPVLEGPPAADCLKPQQQPALLLTRGESAQLAGHALDDDCDARTTVNRSGKTRRIPLHVVLPNLPTPRAAARSVGHQAAKLWSSSAGKRQRLSAPPLGGKRTLVLDDDSDSDSGL